MKFHATLTRLARVWLRWVCLKVFALHHAGLVVADLERSMAFYRDAFGLELAERLDFGGERLAFLRVGQARLELIESTPGPTRRTGVVDHIAFEVPDLDDLLLHLEQRGVTLLDRQPVAVPGLNARILFCLGPDGERIELFERGRTPSVRAATRAG